MVQGANACISNFAVGLAYSSRRDYSRFRHAATIGMPNFFFSRSILFGKDYHMLRWALIFLIVALIAGVLGFGGIEGQAAWIAKVLLLVFVVLAILSFAKSRRKP